VANEVIVANLVDVNAGSGLRKAMDAALSQERAAGSPLYLLIDLAGDVMPIPISLAR
jgi:hypothetical protein